MIFPFHRHGVGGRSRPESAQGLDTNPGALLVFIGRETVSLWPMRRQWTPVSGEPHTWRAILSSPVQVILSSHSLRLRIAETRTYILKAILSSEINKWLPWLKNVLLECIQQTRSPDWHRSAVTGWNQVRECDLLNRKETSPSILPRKLLETNSVRVCACVRVCVHVCVCTGTGVGSRWLEIFYGKIPRNCLGLQQEIEICIFP